MLLLAVSFHVRNGRKMLMKEISIPSLTILLMMKVGVKLRRKYIAVDDSSFGCPSIPSFWLRSGSRYTTRNVGGIGPNII